MFFGIKFIFLFFNRSKLYRKEYDLLHVSFRMLSKTIQPKDYTKTNILVISNLPQGCTPDQLWQLFTILCGPAFIAVKQNNAESCLAVFINQPEARLAQKALEFIIFKNHILSSKGFDYNSPLPIIPQFFQISQIKPGKHDLPNIIPVVKNTENIPSTQAVYISKLRKSRKLTLVKDKIGSDEEQYPMLE